MTAIELKVKAGKDAVCETQFTKWSALPSDTPIEEVLDLKFPVKERTKSSPNDIGSRILGRVIVRFILTKSNGGSEVPPLWNSASTVPTGSGFTECQHYDNNKAIRKSVKTGDLIVFQEAGLLGHAVSLRTNTPFARVGIVLKLPDRYTDKVRPFVLELTSNPQKFINVITEEPSVGVVLFRLWERVHSFQGGCVWLLPLLEPCASDPLHNLVESSKLILSTPSTLPEKLVSTPAADLMALLHEIGIKDPNTFYELFSATLCTALLKMGGKRFTDPLPLQTRVTPKEHTTPTYSFSQAPFYTPATLVAQRDIFGALIPLRMMQ